MRVKIPRPFQGTPTPCPRPWNGAATDIDHHPTVRSFCMAQRRKGTLPQRVRLTQQTTDLIDAYQEQHQIPSFSATVEVLVRQGLAQSPAEILAPIIVSTLRTAVHRELQRLIQLQLYTAIEAGVGQRFAAAAVRDIGRLKHDAPERYDNIKAAAIADTRRRLLGDNIAKVVADLYV